MRLVLGILGILLSLAILHRYQVDAEDGPTKKELTACNMNKECTWVKSPCGTPQAVNLVYREELEKKYTEARENEDCLWQDTRDVTAAYCLDGQCTLRMTSDKKTSDQKKSDP